MTTIDADAPGRGRGMRSQPSWRAPAVGGMDCSPSKPADATKRIGEKHAEQEPDRRNVDGSHIRIGVSRARWRGVRS